MYYNIFSTTLQRRIYLNHSLFIEYNSIVKSAVILMTQLNLVRFLSNCLFVMHVYVWYHVGVQLITRLRNFEWLFLCQTHLSFLLVLKDLGWDKSRLLITYKTFTNAILRLIIIVLRGVVTAIGMGGTYLPLSLRYIILY